ncbi:phospholipase D-like domain-containing protein [[Limnothrix rosea] IAM M-220]|uniref:phospholipase D-like domain-containing protein n=1 Tax=[Limnothrix rosea] IAM M-220 TaxID=454133 RepID=UPI000A050AB5|nr:phosphatidylserine/phosphatidylglycerophosphate/cardiolipin synthase family protein [[Limnothrix rosea] IAM M-220]
MAQILLVIFILCLFPLSWLYVRGMFRRHQTFNIIGIPANDARFGIALASLSDSHLTSGEAVHFYTNIDQIQQARLEAIASAKNLICFETFKMAPGKRADDFAAALKKKAREGILVQILVDSNGAKKLPQRYWQQLKRAGVKVCFFNRFSWRSPIEYLRRNHRKLMIVDQRVALIGGVGIADFWDGVIPKNATAPWLDFEVHWQGEAVSFLTGLFWQHWLSSGGKVDLRLHQPNISQPEQPEQILITSGEDPTPKDSPIRSLFQTAALAAQQRIWIASPYLLPDDETTSILIATKAADIDVRIMTMGVCNDKSYVYYTSRQNYAPLLKGGVAIYEYQPSMMHAKVILIDNEWVCLGSANLDPRSFYHNDELNICSPQASLVESIDQFFRAAFAHSHLVDYREWGDRPLKQKILGRLFNVGYWQL